MALGAGLLVTISTFDDHNAGQRSTSMIGYVVGFMVLFILSGMGNGSVFKLIPSVFEARSHRPSAQRGRTSPLVARQVGMR